MNGIEVRKFSEDQILFLSITDRLTNLRLIFFLHVAERWLKDKRKNEDRKKCNKSSWIFKKELYILWYMLEKKIRLTKHEEPSNEQ